MRGISVLALVVSLAAAASGWAQPRPGSVDARIAELSAADAATRAFAACYLARMRRDAAPAIPALTRALADATPLNPVSCDEERYVVLTPWRSSPGLEAARALAATGDAGVDALLTSASSTNVDVRRHALTGLTWTSASRLRDAAPVEMLLGALGDRDPDIRATAARLLGRTQRRR